MAKKKAATSRKKTNRAKPKKAEEALTGNSGKRSPGRPAGSKTLERPSTEAHLSCCPRCGCTKKRTVGQGPIIQKHSHKHHGNYYSHIVRRRVICQHCGQHRMETTRENWPEEIAESN